MIALLMAGVTLIAGGAVLWQRAAPVFAYLQRQARTARPSFDIDTDNANAWAAAASPAAGRRRVRLVAAVIVVTGLVLAGLALAG